LREAANGPTQEQLDAEDQAEAERLGITEDQVKDARSVGMPADEYAAYSTARTASDVEEIERNLSARRHARTQGKPIGGTRIA
jgi:hypothetical protein